MLSLVLSSPHSLVLHKKPAVSLLTPLQRKSFSSFPGTPQSNYGCHPLRLSPNHHLMEKNKKRGGLGAVCYSAPLSPQTLQWVCTVSSAVLMLARGTAVHKSFLVPFVALQAPTSIVSWIKSDYGAWIAFLSLLVRLFFSIPGKDQKLTWNANIVYMFESRKIFFPGELELPFVALLLVMVAPYQVTSVRGTQAGAIISLVLAGYMAFLHFSRAGSLERAFDQGSIIATVAVIFMTAAPCLLLI